MATNILAYTVMAETATSVILPGEFEEVILVIDSHEIWFSNFFHRLD
jgi:hypothetical protein